MFFKKLQRFYITATNNNPANDTLDERRGRLASANASIAAYAAEPLDAEVHLVQWNRISLQKKNPFGLVRLHSPTNAQGAFKVL